MKMLLLLSFLALVHLMASVSKGKEIYAKYCVSCHVKGKYLAQNKKAKEWKKLLKADALDRLHQDKNISLPYFKTQAFEDDKVHLKALLQRYSKDRGSHNSCY